jgi:hypothetical protein
MIVYRAAGFGLLLMFMLVSAVRADPEECREAIDKYNAAKNDVADALRAYANCVSDSRGHDDCSLEFSTLQLAQSDFENAVLAYGSDCQ